MQSRQGEPDVKLDNLTRQDLKKIQKSMKKPQFMGLLNEYMIQISDPKNKNQYDQYLRQLQRQKELPKHMKIAEITPKFCFRTFLVSQKNKKHQMKFFINMCQSQYLQRPGCQPQKGENGEVGYSWKVPNSMGKIRYDQDKNGNPCQVVDIAFHPDNYYFAVKKEFQEMMINIALQAAQRQLGQRKETLSRDYVILKNLKCKGHDGKPALMPIRYIEGKLYNKGEGPTDQPQRDTQGKQTKLQKQITKQKQEFDKENKEKQKKKEEEEEEQQIEDKPKLVVDMDQGVQRPKYSTIYTYPVDYAEYIDSPYAKKRTIPSSFNIQFAIPRVESMQEVAGQTLQINDKKILLKIGQKYFIDLQLQELKLKYILLTSNAKAKYDKKKKSLRIIIPVDQSVKYEPQKIQQQVKQDEEQKDNKDNVVEDQTWKNKVLDFSQPSVSTKIIQNKQETEEKPKLVEQIDQQDIIQEKKIQSQAKNQQINEEQEIQQDTNRQNKKFTISSYHQKPKKQSKEKESKRIGYVFQETSDKLVLVFQMKNYKKDDVKQLNIDNQQFMILWDQSSKGDENMFKYQHLILNQSFRNKVQKVQGIFRVGFLVIMVNKNKQNKGVYWQKQSIEKVQHQGHHEEEQLSTFQQIFQAKVAEEEKKKKQFQQIKERQRILKEEEQVQKLKESKAKAIEAQKQQIAEDLKENAQESNEEARKPEVEQKETKIAAISNQNESIFQNLQPQFINFEAPFVFALD